MITDTGGTCKNDNWQPVCTSFDTNGSLEITKGTWSYGCEWSYNHANPWRNLKTTVSSYCTNYWKCEVPILESSLATCYTNTSSITEFDYTETYVCHDKGWYTCNKQLPSYKPEQYYSICGALYWGYTCHSKF